MATKVAQKREYLAMQKSPPPFIWACPEEKNILDWHFIIRGPPDTPYAGGEYHGLIWFPSDYPFKPPDVKMFTPSGRFETGHKICMSMTSYHPSTWNAAWSVATILTGLLSFMLSDEITAGAVRTTDEQKKLLAKQSHGFNISNKKFRDIFPTYAGPEMTDLPDMGKSYPAPPASKVVNPSSTLSLPTSNASSKTSTLDPENTIAGSSSSLPSEANTDSSSPSTTIPTPLLTPAPTDPNSSPSTANLASEGKQQILHPRQPQQGPPAHAARWMPSWRWVIAVVVVAVLGRLSSFAGL
ncbi:ubiquitin-conjugating enzyme E2 J2 [Kwoniella heveanensis BCC8398]|uniref:Ubiquitin-conjugating enzyme E2 J2 n=1 Tax=Kwoniella heveanensis BCC8398 TaxID=1296120 RepID=A0A1B9GN13_9TREE|nr:ubiquitin-conjugating enzyme E2 J2 [Kwoniella heveanensis BCC8398]